MISCCKNYNYRIKKKAVVANAGNIPALVNLSAVVFFILPLASKPLDVSRNKIPANTSCITFAMVSHCYASSAEERHSFGRRVVSSEKLCGNYITMTIGDNRRRTLCFLVLGGHIVDLGSNRSLIGRCHSVQCCRRSS